MLFRSDGKSTRLNSSHTIISYAVFCLKKKNTTQHPPHVHACSQTTSCSALPHTTTCCVVRLIVSGCMIAYGFFPDCLFFFFLIKPAPPEFATLSLPRPFPF